jgi:hypothetical protein
MLLINWDDDDDDDDDEAVFTYDHLIFLLSMLKPWKAVPWICSLHMSLKLLCFPLQLTFLCSP